MQKHGRTGPRWTYFSKAVPLPPNLVWKKRGLHRPHPGSGGGDSKGPL